MGTFAWILLGSFLMSAIALVGSFTLLMSRQTLERWLVPLISLAAGTLLGGAFFHMIPEGSQQLAPLDAAAWLVAGFTTFLGLEQFLQWHHGHGASEKSYHPVSYLILIGDGVHNFLGGLGIASTFLIDPRAGVVAWLSAAVHEVPQELGDFGVLVHSGWRRKKALMWNFISALTFPLGAVLAYLAAQNFEVSGLVLFGAGNFIYIAASDLIPEIKVHEKLASSAFHFSLVVLGLALMYALAFAFHPEA